MTGENKTQILKDDNPTAKQRAFLIVKRLENFIREGRANERGIPFKHWQEMAIDEFTNAINEFERVRQNENRFISRILIAGASAMTTIGFWGIVLTTEIFFERQMVAIIIFAAGIILLLLWAIWVYNRLRKRFIKERRNTRIKRIRSFDNQLINLDKTIEERLNRKIF